jgi:hypothetical protein
LTGGQWSGTSIFSTGGCLTGNAFEKKDGLYPDIAEIFTQYSGCQLVLKQGDKETSLLATHKIILSQVQFKVIPFDSEANYFFSDAYEDEILINDIAKPAFRAFLHLYSPFYQPEGRNQIDQPLQLFFNLNAPLPSFFS